MYRIQDDVILIGKTIIKPEKSFSFNAYLITGEQNVLIDTVPAKSSESFWQEVEDIVPIDKLDILILNHSEEDHSGALPYLFENRPDIPVYCTASCAERLKGLYPQGRNWHLVKHGDVLNIGENRILRFYETPGLHWDDNMVTYLESNQVLFSNDLFGQTIGSETPIDTEIELEILERATKDYFNRVFFEAAAEQKQVIRFLLELPIKYIATGHGVVIKEKCVDLIKWYHEMISQSPCK